MGDKDRILRLLDVLQVEIDLSRLVHRTSLGHARRYVAPRMRIADALVLRKVLRKAAKDPADG